MAGASCGIAYWALAAAALAAGDAATAQDATEAAGQHLSARAADGGDWSASAKPQAALAGGDLVAARRWADEAVVDNDRLVPVGGADDARPRGDRAR